MEFYLAFTIVIVISVSVFLGYEICAWRMHKHLIAEKENLQRAIIVECNLRDFQHTVKTCINLLRKVKGNKDIESKAIEQVTEVLRQAYVASSWREP